MEQTEKQSYRVVTMIPTEICVEAESTEDAASTVEWLLEQYPSINIPVSDQSDTEGEARARIMTVESL